MSKLLALLVLFIALAVLRAVLVVLVAALLLALVFSFLTRPRRTLLFLSALLCFGLASARPATFLVAAILGLAVAVVAAMAKTEGQVLLNDGRGNHSK